MTKISGKALENLTPGQTVVTDIEQSVMDFSIFVKTLDGKAVVVDAVYRAQNGKNYLNVAEYDAVYLLPSSVEETAEVIASMQTDALAGTLEV